MELIGPLGADNLNRLTETAKGWRTLAEVGRSRKGMSRTGSPLWSDVGEHVRFPWPTASQGGYDFQVFGHTKSDHPLQTVNFAMLDCQRCFVMTEEAKLSDTEIIQGKVSIGKTHHTSKCRQALRAAFPYTIPIFAGYWFLGLTYGILMNVSGFSFVWPMVMAAVIYSGSVEFVAVKVLLSSFHPLQAFVMAFMIGARHLFYGITMLDRFKHKGWKKPLLIYFMSDETFSVNYTAKIPKGVDKGWFMQKWLYIDPTMDAWVTDENGTMLSIAEVRERLINNQP